MKKLGMVTSCCGGGVFGFCITGVLTHNIDPNLAGIGMAAGVMIWGIGMAIYTMASA